MLSRRTLVLIHGYIAVFFLPFALLYAITGGLYILGETGGDERNTVEVTVSSPPENTAAAIELITPALTERGWRIPKTSDNVRELQGGYYWGRFDETLRFAPSNNGNWVISHQQNSWYKQLVEIHKDHAGIYFSILGFGFAIGMFVLVISGAIMMFQSPVYRNTAIKLLAGGVVVTVCVWVLSIFS